MKKIVGKIIVKLKQNKRIRDMFLGPIKLNSFPKMGTFTDSVGNSHVLYNGLRSKLKPEWQKMVASNSALPKTFNFEALVAKGNEAAQKLIETAEIYGKDITQTSILEIGCNTGATSFALAQKGAVKVVGTEFSGYKVSSIKKNGVTKESLQEIADDLKNARETLSGLFTNYAKVEFADDDICNSKLEQNRFDLICSWDVLEHLHNTTDAFSSMRKLLSPGGIMIHEYNPYFCLNGGHSMCTLDFPWGHTRLNEQDFSRYIDEVRPNEKDKAISFYRKNKPNLAASQA